jgi:hypothetical protein
MLMLLERLEVFKIKNMNSYIIIESFEFDLVNINQITGWRTSVDGSKIIISYETEPAFFSLLTTKQGPFTQENISNIVQSPEWS